MNKFGTAIILVAASVYLVSAASKQTRDKVGLAEPVTFAATTAIPSPDQDQDEISFDPSYKVPHHGHGYGYGHGHGHEEEDDEEQYFLGQPKYKHGHGHKVQGFHQNSEQDGHQNQFESQDGHNQCEGHAKGVNNYKKGGNSHSGFKHQDGSYGHQVHHPEFKGYHDQPEVYQGHKQHHGHGHKQHHGHKPHFGHKEPHHHHQHHQHHHHHEQPEEPEHHVHHEHQHHGGKHGHKHGHKQGFRSAKQGSASAFEEREASKGSLSLQDDERERVHAEGSKFGNKFIAKGKFNENINKSHNEDTGIHKLQKINVDKTIIKDKSTGSNDVEVSHHVNDSKNVGVQGSGVIINDKEFSNNRVDAEREHDRDLNTNNASFKEKEGASANFFEF